MTPAIPLTATVTETVEQEIVFATVHEVFQSRTDDVTHPPYYFDHEPTLEEVVAFGFTQGTLYPLESRDGTEITHRFYDENQPATPYAAQLRQWNWQNLERDVTLQIPRSELPGPYTPEDIIAWGRAAGKLQLPEA